MPTAFNKAFWTAPLDAPYATARDTTGTYYRIYVDSTIRHNANPGAGSYNWRCVGAHEYNNFGHVVKRLSLEDVLYEALPWTWKNGSQRTHLCDYDHGSRRTWMSPGHMVYRLTRPSYEDYAHPGRRFGVFDNKTVEVSGPYFKSALAYGKRGMADAAPTLQRHEWYLSWQKVEYYRPEPTAAELEWDDNPVMVPLVRIEPHIVTIVHYQGQDNRYIISQTHPTIEAPTFDAIVRRALKADYHVLG
jgi:hypothetical protein